MEHSSIKRLTVNDRIRWRVTTTLLPLLILLFASCSAIPTSETAADGAPPVAEQQIVNVVEDYYTRQSGVLPEYEAKIELVQDNWARVSIHPVGVEESTNPELFYLQNQLEADNPLPTPTVVVSPQQTAPRSTETGWAIIVGPQVHFSSEELDNAGVPDFIRP